MRHLLFRGTQSIVNSARCHQVISKTGWLVQVKRVPATGGWALRSVLFRALRWGGQGKGESGYTGISTAEFNVTSPWRRRINNAGLCVFGQSIDIVFSPWSGALNYLDLTTTHTPPRHLRVTPSTIGEISSVSNWPDGEVQNTVHSWLNIVE
jgi:hypothetical protein